MADFENELPRCVEQIAEHVYQGDAPAAAESAHALKGAAGTVIGGNMQIGLADGFDDLVVRIPGDSKSVFPRHIGILGTTGGGKSTTVSGLVAKAQQAGISIVIIDTEGEYCSIHEPTDDKQMLEALKRRGMEPAGVANTQILHLVGRETANPAHPKVSPFSLRFSDLSPYALQEILDLSEAQEIRFFKAFDVAKLAMERTKIWPKTDADKNSSLSWTKWIPATRPCN